MAKAFPESAGRGLEEFQRIAKPLEDKSIPADVGKFLGEYGPDFALGMKAFSLGRQAFVRSLQLGAKATGAKAGTTTTLGKIVARSKDFAGSTAPTVKPGLERAVEIVGGAVGEGAFFGTREGLDKGFLTEDGELRPEVVKEAAVAAALTIGFEGGLTLGGRLLFGRGKPIDPREALKAFEAPGGGREILTKSIRSERKAIRGTLKTVRKQFEGMNQALRVREVEGELYDAIIRTPGEFEMFVNASKAQKLLTPQQAKKAIAASRTLRKADVNLRAAKRILDDPANINFTSMGPANVKGIREGLNSISVGLLRSPEGQMARQGPTAAKALAALKQADDVVQMEGSFFEATIQKLANDARKAAGFSVKQAVGKKGKPSAFLELSHAWETGGDAALLDYVQNTLKRTPAQARVVLNSFNEMTKLMDDMNRVLQGSTVGRAPIPLDGTLGVSRYIPHLAEPGTSDEIFEFLARRHGEAFATKVLDGAGRTKRGVLGEIISKGETRLGPVDFDRTLVGSTKDKIQAGLPLISNPFEAGLQALLTGSRRNNYGRVLGKDNELIKTIVKAVRNEGGNSVLIDNLLTHIGGTQYYPRYMQDFASIVTSTQVARKLALAVVANMSQTGNTAAMAGIWNTTRGALQLTKRENRARLSQALGVHEVVIRSIGQPFQDDVILRSGSARFADFVLRRSGFSFVEKVNRLIAGSSGQVIFRDLIAKGVKGKLRGNTLDSSRRIMKDLGFNLDDLVRRAQSQGDSFFRSGAFRDAELQAAFRLAQRTQFIPSKFLKPTAWTHPYGRIVFQFKNFAINQARFVADQVFSEAAQGNLRPLATYLGISAISGELVRDARAIITGKERKTDGLARVIENAGSAGGLGLFSDTVQAARFGQVVNVFAGPTVSDVAELGEALLRFDLEKAAGVVLTDQPLFDGVVALGAAPILTGLVIDEYIDSLPKEDQPEQTTRVDLGQLRGEAASRKPR